MSQINYKGILYIKHQGVYIDSGVHSDDYDMLTESLKESTSLASTLQLENINLMAENASLQFRMIELNKQLKK